MLFPSAQAGEAARLRMHGCAVGMKRYWNIPWNIRWHKVAKPTPQSPVVTAANFSVVGSFGVTVS